MFPFANRMKVAAFKSVLVSVLACVFLCGILVPTVFAAKDDRKPYIIPGDGDGPAGVQEAVVIQDRMASDFLPLYLQLGYPSIGSVVIQVAPSRTVIWFKKTSTKPHALGDLRR